MSAMVLTDGVDVFTYNGGISNDDFLNLEKSIALTAGGTQKSQVSGKRFVDTLQLRLTQSDFASLMKLLDKPIAQYFYTPKFIPSYLSDIDFPMIVSVDVPTKKGVVGGGERKFYVELKITSVSYV